MLGLEEYDMPEMTLESKEVRPAISRYGGTLARGWGLREQACASCVCHKFVFLFGARAGPRRPKSKADPKALCLIDSSLLHLRAFAQLNIRSEAKSLSINCACSKSATYVLKVPASSVQFPSCSYAPILGHPLCTL